MKIISNLKLKLLLFIAFLFVALPELHALSFLAEETNNSVAELVSALTPLIIFGVTALFRAISPFLLRNSWATLILVGGLSSLAPIVEQQVLGSTEGSYIAQVGWNLLAIVISQIQRAATGGNKAAHDKKMKILSNS